MAHFYGMVQGNRGLTHRCGSKNSGMDAVAAGWGGSVRVELYHHEGEDYVRVSKQPWRGVGKFQLIYEGPLRAE